MNFYQFHIGDYISHTAHLDLLEDIIYRRLIDLYYQTEKPISSETQSVIKRLRLGSNEETVWVILREFFTLSDIDNCWHHARCDREIAAYQKRCALNRKVGKLGGRPLKTQSVKPKTAETQPVIFGFPKKTPTNNHKPIANTSPPAPLEGVRASPFHPPTELEVRQFVDQQRLNVDPSHFVDFYQSKNWMVGKTKMRDWQAAARNWSRRQSERAHENHRSGHKLTEVERVRVAHGLPPDSSVPIAGTYAEIVGNAIKDLWPEMDGDSDQR